MKYLNHSLLVLVLVNPGLAWSDTANELRSYFEGLIAGGSATIAGERLQSPQRVATFYLENDHQPIWTGAGSLATQYPQLLAAISASAAHGFNPALYHAEVLDSVADGTDADRLAREILATDAFLTQARHRGTGVVSPQALDPDWHLIPQEQSPVLVLQQLIANGGDVETTLESLWPGHDEYQTLVTMRRRIVEGDQTQTPTIPDGPLLKPGQRSPRIIPLKVRLLGPGEYSDEYDTPLQEAVRNFQRAAGLDDDGIVGSGTLEMLNATKFSWIDRIDANLERWRWLPNTLPETMLRVNIAAFVLRGIQQGEETLLMNVIVGRPYRNTPVFSETLKYMVLNPFWNVPFKLATEDKLTILQKNPQQLMSLGYEAKMNGGDQFLPVDAIDWSGVTRRNFNYLLRQRPGPANALGRIKFMLPNPFSVYLHDTPDRQLFNKQERGFSSGCVRLAQPVVLAQWLLNNDGRPQEAATIESLIQAGDTMAINLNKPVPVFIVYFTAFTNTDGDVVFRRDLYQRDAPVIAALRGGG